MTDVNANINIGVNSSDALAGLRKLETQINQFQRTIASSNASAAANQAALNRALLDGINNTGLFTAKQVSAVDSMARFSNALEKNKLSLSEYSRFAASQLPGMSKVFRREFDTMEQVATSRVKAMNTQYIALGKTVDGVTKAIASTPTGLAKGFATETAMAAQKQMIFNKLIDDGSTKLLNWGKNTQWAGRQLMVGLTLPLGAMGAAAAAAFMEIDKASTSLKRVYGDLSTTTLEMNNNVEAVKALGGEYTKYGIAVSDTIAIAARAAATGATNEKLMAATEQTLRFATLGQIDYNQALDTTISMQTAFGVANEDLAGSIDYLNAVENQTILTIEDMSLAIPRVATVVRGLGGDVKDLAVMMTAMREGGVSAENAANGLKSGLASMINPTNKASEYLAKFKINLTGIVEANKGDLIGTIQQFGNELNKLSDLDRQRALEKTFGKYQYARMSALFDNMTKKSGQAARAMDLAGMSMEDLASIADSELGKISESTTVKFQAALEKLKLTIAPIGEAFLKLATPVIDLVTKLAEGFNSLPDPIKNALGIATAAIAGLGPILLMGIGLMGNLVANIVKGVQWWRKLGARIRGDASAFTYMSNAELEAMAATEALEGSTQSLTGKLHLQAGAVAALTAEYQRFAGAAGIASGAMGRFPGMGGGKGKGGPRLKMANGGVVPGTGSGDKIPAMLEPGETVVTKKASKKYGPLINAMNAGTLQGFQGGKNAPQSDIEKLVFAHGQAPVDLADEIVKKIQAEAGINPRTGEPSTLGKATRMQGLSNFGFMTPEKFNQGKMNPADAAKLFSDPKLVDRTMLPMYQAIADEMYKGNLQKAMNDPSVQKNVRAFASNMGKDIAKVTTETLLDEDFYKIADKAVKDTSSFSGKDAERHRAAIEKSRGITTIGAYGGDLRAKGERPGVGRERQRRWFGKVSGVSYRGRDFGEKARLITAKSFGMGVAQEHDTHSPSKEGEKAVEQYVDGMEVGAKKNAKDAAKAGKDTAKAYNDAVHSEITPQSAQRLSKAQYKAQQSQARRNRRNLSVMATAGMTDPIMQQRTLRRLEESQARAARGQRGVPVTPQSGAATRTAAAAADRREAAKQRLKNIKAENRKSMGRSVGKGIGRAGGVLGAASIIPFMAQNEEGKFMGMDANMMGTAMMGASMIGPAFKGLAAGATALSGALGVSVAAVAAPAAALAAVGVSAYLLKKGLDNTVAAGRKYADALTTSAEEQKSVADLFGTKTYADRRKTKQMTKMTGLTAKQQTAGKEFAGTDQGKAMVEEARVAMEKNGVGFARNLATQLSQMVISGAINPEQAQVMAAGITDALGKQEMTADVTAQIKQIIAPNGKDVTRTPLQIQASIQANMETDEARLKKEVESAASTASDSWTDNFLGLGNLYSGEMDAAKEASVAYYNAVISNTSSMLSTIDDQKMALEDQLSVLDKQIKKEDDKKKKIELQNEQLKLQAQLRGLEGKRDTLSTQRRTLALNALRGNAEAMHSGRQAVEEAGISNAQAMFGRDEFNAKTRGYGGLLAGYAGKTMTAKQAEEFEISWIVDLQSGAIDPQALQAVQVMEENKEGTTANIMKMVVDLQAKGDTEEANKILNLTSTMVPEVAVVFNNNIKGKSFEEIEAYGEILNQIPPEVASTVGVELSGLSLEELKEFRKNVENLQGSNVDTAELIKTGGVKAVKDMSDQLKSIDKQLGSKKIQKGLKEIGQISAKNTKARATKTIELVTEMTDGKGNPISPEAAKAAEKEIVDQYGSKKEFYSLPPEVATKVIAMQVDATQYRKLAVAARIAANQLKVAGAPELAAEWTKKADAYNAISQAFSSAALSGAQAGGFGDGGGESSGGVPSATPPESKGGGGKKDNALADMNKGFIDQIKMYTNMNANVKMLNGKREDFVKNLNKGQGIIEELRKTGLSEGIIANLASQGYDALKTAYTKYKGKRGSDAVANQNQLALQSTLATTIDGKVSANINAKNQVAASRRLQGMGLSGDQITSLVEDPEIAKGIANLGKKGGITAKELQNLINKTKTLDETLRQAARAADPLAAAIEDVSNATAMASASIEAQNAILALQSDQAFAAANNGMTKQQAELEIALNNEKIKGFQKLIDAKQEANDLDQREIDLLERSKKQWQDKIDLLQTQIDGYQKSIDIYQRENELRDQQANVINHSLDVMSRKEADINEVYDTRIKALDEVASINQHILDQQQSQLNISQALSSGDVYAAAQAQQELQAQSVQYSADQMRAGLDAAKQNAISGLTTESGLTRAQAEQRIADLKEQNYQNDLLVTGLQNQIYTTTQAMLPYKQQISDIDKNIAGYNETIWQRNQQIYDIQQNSIKPINTINTAIQEKLDKSALDLQIAEANSKFLGLNQQQWDAIGRVSSGVLTVIQNQATATQETITAVNALADAWANVGKTAAAATAAGTTGSFNGAVNSGVKYSAKNDKGLNWAQISKDLGVTDLEAMMKGLGIDPGLVSTLASSASTQKKYKGGMIRKYASGSFVPGSGGRDSVSAMLTPGEFVVRKSMVSKYGPAMFDSINQGSFSMPRYNMESGQSTGTMSAAPSANINAPVYNTYSINVPVTQPGASADEIANKVMMKIKNVDNSSIRRINGY